MQFSLARFYFCSLIYFGIPTNEMLAGKLFLSIDNIAKMRR